MLEAQVEVRVPSNFEARHSASGVRPRRRCLPASLCLCVSLTPSSSAFFSRSTSHPRWVRALPYHWLPFPLAPSTLSPHHLRHVPILPPPVTLSEYPISCLAPCAYGPRCYGYCTPCRLASLSLDLSLAYLLTRPESPIRAQWYYM